MSERQSLTPRRWLFAATLSPAAVFVMLFASLRWAFVAYESNHLTAQSERWFSDIACGVELHVTFDSAYVSLSEISLYGVSLREDHKEIATISAISFIEPSCIQIFIHGRITPQKVLCDNAVFLNKSNSFTNERLLPLWRVLTNAHSRSFELQDAIPEKGNKERNF